MSEVGPQLRRLFISFNIFSVIAGGLIIVVSSVELPPSQVDLNEDFEGRTTNRTVLSVAGSVTMVTAILGAFAALKRNRMSLYVYLACLVVGSLLMCRVGVSAAAARPEFQRLMEDRRGSFLPLDQASADIKNQAEALQTSLHCCGLFSYEDWRGNIPDSCLCSPEEETEVKCATVDYKNFLSNLFWQKKSVFKQPCTSLIMDSVITNAKITLGVIFSLFVLVLPAYVLCSLMIYQMSNTPNTPTPSAVMFIDQPPSYQQLYNLE